ncbi:hypothetical protein FNH09_14545 [Streptomyces adustus]|uniref:Uncharacterized protein n=1 Tax=Streptomyces adustus TaxID=1609272 RepID=A0A5N8VB08_9ACTN|nr:hypothetical protein [Streptomyces adustus]MPY32441.1 hypothetical protein [Streptomyces adustus]
MIILGVILLVIGFLTGISILWTIGIILLILGAVLWILGAMGHAVAGRTDVPAQKSRAPRRRTAQSPAQGLTS